MSPSAAGFPLTPEDVTPTWLSSVLDLDICATTVLDQHSGTTGRLRLGVTYGSGDGPASLFIKLPPTDEAQRQLVAASEMGRTEARFYAGPAAEVPMRIPRAFYAAAGDEPTEYVMVLEDLQASGVTFGDLLQPHPAGLNGPFLEDLARHHAHFWQDPRFDGELAWVRPPLRGSYAAKLVASAKQQLAADLPPVFSELCDLYVEHHRAITDLWDDGEQTLIHGDVHLGNHLVDAGRVGLYDWAFISRAPGIRDVGIYLSNSCPTEDREAGQAEWLQGYHRVLVESGVEAPSLETLWLRYRRCVLYGWVSAATTAAMGDKWQPIEVGRQAVDRATAACASLDTLDAIRSAL